MKVLKALTRVGPAFVIAAVVLGPGSVTTMTKMGAKHGYDVLWLPVLASVLMAGFVALFMRYGIHASCSYLQHCADVCGRWFAALSGLSMFYVATAFQFGNNIGVITALNSLLRPPGGPEPAIPAWVWPVVFNALALAFLFSLRRIYSVLEKMMTALVAVMLIAFFVNLFFVRPSASGIARGLVPSIPQGMDWMVAAGLVATTFSIVGAIFQTYLVRARGWKRQDFSKGVADSASGIGMLMLISLIIMITSAAALHPMHAEGLEVNDASDMAALHPKGLKIETAGDMAVQLETVFGAAARVIFCVGFAAAAFSSFLVNAMIGGTLLSDGLGLSDDVNSLPAKVCSAGSLLVGMVVAMLVTQWKTVDHATALVVAQAGTLLAIPLAIASALVVLLHPRPAGVPRLKAIAVVFVLVGAGVLVAIAVRSYFGTIPKLLKMFSG